MPVLIVNLVLSHCWPIFESQYDHLTSFDFEHCHGMRCLAMGLALAMTQQDWLACSLGRDYSNSIASELTDLKRLGPHWQFFLHFQILYRAWALEILASKYLSQWCMTYLFSLCSSLSWTSYVCCKYLPCRGLQWCGLSFLGCVGQRLAAIHSLSHAAGFYQPFTWYGHKLVVGSCL